AGPGPEAGAGTWDEFLRRRAPTLWACDFLSVRSLTVRGFIDLFHPVLHPRRQPPGVCRRGYATPPNVVSGDPSTRIEGNRLGPDRSHTQSPRYFLWTTPRHMSRVEPGAPPWVASACPQRDYCGGRRRWAGAPRSGPIQW